VPEESRASGQVIAKKRGKKAIKPRPALKKYAVSLTPTDINDPKADRERLEAALDEVHIA